MYSFLQQYPYNMGEHTLTCTLSPNAEAAEAEVVKKEVKKEELSRGSSGLKKYPEGSGMVQTAAANHPVEPSVAKKGPAPLSHIKDEVSLEHSECHLDRALRDSALRPPGTAVVKVEAGLEATVIPSSNTSRTEASEAKPEEMLLPPSSVKREEAGKDKSDPTALQSAVAFASEKQIKQEKEELTVTGPPEELSSVGKAEDAVGKPAVGEAPGAGPEMLPPGPPAASGESSGVTQMNHGVEAPAVNPLSGAVKSGQEVAVTPLTEKKRVLRTGLAMEKNQDVPGEVNPEESNPEGGGAVEENLEKLLVKTGAETEKKLEKAVVKVGAAVENAASERKEGSLIKAHQSQGAGPSKRCETPRAVTFNSSLSAKESPFLGKTFLKAVVSLQDISKSRVSAWRNKPFLYKGGEQKAPARPESQSQAVLEKRKEEDHSRPGGSPSSLGEGDSKWKASRSPVLDGKGENGRNSSQQEKDSRVESRASSKHSQEGESGTSSMKKDTSSNKVSAGDNTKPAKSGSSSSVKKEEELFPFNLDEFVTVDEVVEEVDSPVRTRRNPPRGKRKDGAKGSSCAEPSSKRRKGKSTAARGAESELSFVTLDEIGEEEDVPPHLLGLPPLEALSDPQSLLVVDEVMEEEEALLEVVKDPQALLAWDELAEQEDLGSQRDIPRAAFEEQGLKAEPLVTVDEIGEVEELPLNEPTDLNMEGVLKHKEGEDKVAAEDAGDSTACQVPDDPSALMTVDEIQEDNEDNPLVTLDEVNDDEDDFLADFNHLKEELNFVTVDEVGEEDEEEENTLPGKSLKKNEDIIAVAGPEEEEIAAVAGPEEEDIVAVAGPEEMDILGDMSPEEEMMAVSKSKGKEPLVFARGERANQMLSTAYEILAANRGEIKTSNLWTKLMKMTLGVGGNLETERDQLGSRDKEPESKEKKVAPSDVSKAQSTPKALDYLVPKAGFFCQICSLFYADETSVKNHCRTLLHQQNMEKFMAKQKDDDTSGEEPSSR
ncbi:ZN638 protein, partial [Bucco capensis]|nr:ZN638 protein [Bucco capensis]